MIGFFRFILVVMLLVIVGMTSAVLTMHFAIHGSEVSIPDFHGMTIADAGQRAAAAGLSLHVENKLYSADVPAGRVANQSPTAGAIVRRGWRVWLAESLGPQKLAIPNVLGQDQRIASIDIRRAGLQTGSVAVLAQSGQAGAVIAQSPAPDASGVSSPVVNLLVAAEAAPPQSSAAFVMPDLQGQLFTSAAFTLAHAGLQMAPLKTQSTHVPPVATPGAPTPPLPAPAGTILAQNPPAGSRVDPSMPIQLTVAE